MVVGAGGGGGTHPTSPISYPAAGGVAGNNSTGFGKTATGAPSHFNPSCAGSKYSGSSGAPQSNAGGTPQPRGGAGGGGAGGVGGNAGPPQGVGGAGGAGWTSPVDCTLHGGGGGGAGWEASSGAGAGAAGPGGGGAGGAGTANAGANADANKGGGGGGGAGDCGVQGTTAAGGNGGSGIVVVKELNKASGVWNLRSQLKALQQGTWPKLLLASFNMNYLVVAGGGSGSSGAGGAGGYRASGFGPSPLQGSALTFSGLTPGATFPVTIGAGASAGANSGNATTFSPAVNTITSAGGGRGSPDDGTGKNGGSGGGSRVYPPEGAIVAAGSGNTPPTDPSQGNPGGTITFTGSIGPQGGATIGFSGGGGATAAGSAVTIANNFTISSGSLDGGAGAPNTILGPDTSYAGGGGGYTQSGASFVAGGAGGAGGGGTTTYNGTDCGGAAGAANTGGGAGTDYSTGGFAGGSGIVVVRVPSARTLAVSPGTNALSTHPGGDKIAKFTVSGVLTVT